MRNRLPIFSGLALATLGVSGLAGGGLLWNFQGRTLGLGSTVTSLVFLGISFVLLRPEPRDLPVAASEDIQPLKVRAPQASVLGLILATIGTLGMAGSGLLWNFQGLAFGLTGTLTAAVALLLSLVFLWPLGSTKLTGQGDTSSVEIKPIKVEAVSQNPTPTPTTAEAIAEVLAAEQKELSEPTLVNYAPLHLLPGQRLSTRARRGGSSLGRYRSMAKDLFRS
ncbi:hypothetical protein FZZ92_11850 [Synechococcus sp. MU1611]|nr:hypothetical protein [Synechococcus sp. MU1611]